MTKQRRERLLQHARKLQSKAGDVGALAGIVVELLESAPTAEAPVLTKKDHEDINGIFKSMDLLFARVFKRKSVGS